MNPKVIRELIDKHFSLQWCRDNFVCPIRIDRNDEGNDKLIIAIGNKSYLVTIGSFMKKRVAKSGFECVFIEMPHNEIHDLLEDAAEIDIGHRVGPEEVGQYSSRMQQIPIKNLFYFFLLCLPAAVIGAVIVHVFGLIIDPIPGGVFCVDDLCRGHGALAYQLNSIRVSLIIYLSVLVWFWAGMLPARSRNQSVKKMFMVLLTATALVPLILLWVVLQLSIPIVLAGIATVWIPRINRQILG